MDRAEITADCRSPGALCHQLGPVLPSKAGRLVRLTRNVEWCCAEGICQLQPGSGWQVQGSHQIEPGAILTVSGYLQLAPYRSEAHFTSGDVDCRVHPRLHQLLRLRQQLRRDTAVGLPGSDGLLRAEDSEVGQTCGGSGDFPDRSGVEPRCNGSISCRSEPGDRADVEYRLRST